MRRLQLDEAGAAELAQREFAEEVRAAFALEFGGDAEQALGAHLAPIVEAVVRLDLVSTPSIHGGPHLQRNCPQELTEKKQIPEASTIVQTTEPVSSRR